MTKTKIKPKLVKPDIYTQVLKKEVGVEVVREYRFDADRRFRFDYALPDLLIAIEIDGGVWMDGGGRHNRAAGFLTDLEKLNLAASKGWRVLRFTHQNKFLKSNIDIIKKTINHNTNDLCADTQ